MPAEPDSAASPPDDPAVASSDRGPVLVLALLIVIFVLVSAVAYTDYPKASWSVEPMNELENDGLGVWRRENCQACHQLYGFGGFHGPDLTNYVDETRYDHEFTTFLTVGQGRMPALDLSEHDQAAVLAFLRAVDRTGRSEPRPLRSRKTVDERAHLGLLVDAWRESVGGEVPTDAAAGLKIWNDYCCGSCHTPLEAGRHRAPDVTRNACDRRPTALAKLLGESRGRMPSFSLDAAQIDSLAALLTWCNETRAELVSTNDRLLDRESFDVSDIPWFEYE